MKALAEALHRAFWATGWGSELLDVFFGLSVLAVFVLPMLRPFTRSWLALRQDARRTALLQLILHGGLLGATIGLGKAVCVERVVSNPWGSFHARGDLLEDETLWGIMAVYALIDGVALAVAWAGASDPKREAWVDWLGGFVDACVWMPVFVATCWEMNNSMRGVVPFFGFEAWLFLLVPVGLALWAVAPYLTRRRVTTARRT